MRSCETLGLWGIAALGRGGASQHCRDFDNVSAATRGSADGSFEETRRLGGVDRSSVGGLLRGEPWGDAARGRPTGAGAGEGLWGGEHRWVPASRRRLEFAPPEGRADAPLGMP